MARSGAPTKKNTGEKMDSRHLPTIRDCLKEFKNEIRVRGPLIAGEAGSVHERHWIPKADRQKAEEGVEASPRQERKICWSPTAFENSE